MAKGSKKVRAIMGRKRRDAGDGGFVFSEKKKNWLFVRRLRGGIVGASVATARLKAWVADVLCLAGTTAWPKSGRGPEPHFYYYFFVSGCWLLWGCGSPFR